MIRVEPAQSLLALSSTAAWADLLSRHPYEDGFEDWIDGAHHHLRDWARTVGIANWPPATPGVDGHSFRSSSARRTAFPY